jgi:DNA repair protein RadC
VNIKLTRAQKIPIRKPGDIFKILRQILHAEEKTDQDKEHFWTVGLEINHVIKYIELVSLGSAEKSVAEPREVFRIAVMRNVPRIILAHNHPSGSLKPSSEDLRVSKTLSQSGRILGIEVLDHLIITQRSFLSFADKGLL